MPLKDLLVDPASPARALAGVMAFYVSGEEALESRMFNTAVGLTVTIGVRFMLVTGEVLRYNFTHTPNTTGTLDRQRFALPEGWILNATVNASAGTPTGTTCLCVLRIVAGLTSNAVPLGVLCQGAITASQELSYPLTLTTAGSGSGLVTPGTVSAKNGTVPAAGAEVSETVPAGKLWNLVSFHLALTTSVAVANRRPYLVLDDGTNNLFKQQMNANETASATWLNFWAPTGESNANDGQALIGVLPIRMLLPAGSRIRTITGGIQAADQYAAPRYVVEEWTP